MVNVWGQLIWGQNENGNTNPMASLAHIGLIQHVVWSVSAQPQPHTGTDLCVSYLFYSNAAFLKVALKINRITIISCQLINQLRWVVQIASAKMLQIKELTPCTDGWIYYNH